MDVEIVKSNGQKFRLSDYGVVQDFVVNSIDRSVTRESVDGRKGSVDYGTNIGDRSISVPMIFKARDLHDYAHLRDELFGILDDDEPFYIREMRRKDYLQYEFVDFGQSPTWSNGIENEYVNGKQYKVRMDSNISPEQWDDKPNGDITIEFVTSGLPFAESIYTTLELHDSGYSAMAEKYGLVDNIDDEKVKYRFEPGLKTVTLKASDFEQGSIASSSGANVANAAEIRTVSHFDTVPGETLIFKDVINGDNINYWWLFEYDKNGGYLGFYSTPIGGNGEVKFVAKGHRLRVRSNSYNGIKPSDVGVHTLPTISGVSMINNFTVHNAGNVTVEPESMLLHIFVASTTGDSITIKNNTTGETFTLNRKMNARHIQVNGMVVTDGTTQVFRDTNKRFISLAPGDNKITVTGAAFNEIRFNFKYYYK